MDEKAVLSEFKIIAEKKETNRYGIQTGNHEFPNRIMC